MDWWLWSQFCDLPVGQYDLGGPGYLKPAIVWTNVKMVCRKLEYIVK